MEKKPWPRRVPPASELTPCHFQRTAGRVFPPAPGGEVESGTQIAHRREDSTASLKRQHFSFFPWEAQGCPSGAPMPTASLSKDPKLHSGVPVPKPFVWPCLLGAPAPPACPGQPPLRPHFLSSHSCGGERNATFIKVQAYLFSHRSKPQ